MKIREIEAEIGKQVAELQARTGLEPKYIYISYYILRTFITYITENNLMMVGNIDLGNIDTRDESNFFGSYRGLEFIPVYKKNFIRVSY